MILIRGWQAHTPAMYAIKQIKDVDILPLVAATYLDEKPEVVLNDLFSALRGLAEALDDTGEVVRRRQRRSIQVHLVKHDFDLDIVPDACSRWRR